VPLELGGATNDPRNLAKVNHMAMWCYPDRQSTGSCGGLACRAGIELTKARLWSCLACACLRVLEAI
jgi:hypothetical protein